MASPFSSTLRSLETRHSRAYYPGLGLVLLLLLAWLAWFALARVSILAVSTSARLEAAAQPHAVPSSVAGRVTAVSVELGQEVAEGDVILSLDAEQTMRLAEAMRAGRTGALQSIEAVAGRIATERQRLRRWQQSSRQAVQEGRARYRSAQAEERLADEEVDRQRPLVERGIVGRAELERAEAESERAQAAAEAEKQSSARDASQVQVEEGAILSLIEELGADIVRHRTDSEQAAAEIARLEDLIERHTVRAPVAGVVAQLGDLRPGGVIEPGHLIAHIVPTGALRVVAEFEPSSALGRIRTGQAAKVRFDGFPWTQFGSLRATAVRVASEPADGRIRVELEPDPSSAPAIPMAHGLPGEVEIEVERISPAALVLRAAGKTLRAGSAAHSGD